MTSEGADMRSRHRQPDGQTRLDRFVQHYPHAPYVVPFVLFLLFLPLDRVLPDAWRAASYALRCVVSLAAVWAFRAHYSPFGKPRLLIAVPFGLLAAVMWVEVHNWFAGSNIGPSPFLGLFGISHEYQGFSWYKRYALFDGRPERYFIPAEHFTGGLGLWSFLIIRIAGASLVVPLIEEIFWRAFLLRLLINWHHFEDAPLARFTVFSFVVSSLLSGVSHQPQWEVGILCWMLYNGLYYWTRSLMCLMITHGITNLTLYIYVYATGDWRFW